MIGRSALQSGQEVKTGTRRELDKNRLVDDLTDQLERLKASIRAKVEHPFGVIKRQFRHVKVLSGSGQEHRTAAHAVCAVQPVDGAANSDGRVQA